MKILVTGSTGFIGSRLIEKLLANNEQVSVVVRDRTKLDRFSWENKVTVFDGDITDINKLQECCQQQELIIHLAGQAHVSASAKIHERVNYQGTKNILEAAVNAKVKKLIYISSSKAKESGNAYAKAKYKSEKLLLNSTYKNKIDVCCLRPVAVYGIGMKGNLSTWIRAIKHGKAPLLPPLKTRVAMISVDDLCAAIITAITSKKTNGKAYLVADDHEYSMKEIESEIRKSIGKKQNKLYFPKSSFYLMAVVGEVFYHLAGINIGFRKSSFNTLFVEEFSQNSEYKVDTGFKSKQNFYQELPTIINNI